MITIDEILLDKITKEAKKYGLNRSAFITTALNEYMYQRQNANELLSEIFNSDEIKEAIKQKLNTNEI